MILLLPVRYVPSDLNPATRGAPWEKVLGRCRWAWDDAGGVASPLCRVAALDRAPAAAARLRLRELPSLSAAGRLCQGPGGQALPLRAGGGEGASYGLAERWGLDACGPRVSRGGWVCWEE